MLKKIVILLFFLKFLFAINYYIVTFKTPKENNITKLDFLFLTKKLTNNNVFVLYGKGNFFNVTNDINNINEKYFVPIKNNIKNLKRMINLLANKSNLNNSFLIIFNPFEYINEDVNVSTYNKVFNKAWITSNFSPFKCNIFDTYPTKPLEGLKVAIIDSNSKNISYLELRKCFYNEFFSKLGAKLTFYGNPHMNPDLVLKSYENPEILNCIHFNTNKKILMLNDIAINYDFCNN